MGKRRGKEKFPLEKKCTTVKLKRKEKDKQRVDKGGLSIKS